MPLDEDGNLTLPASTPAVQDLISPPVEAPDTRWVTTTTPLVEDHGTPQPLMKPMFDYVLIRPDPSAATSQGGIFIPEGQRQDRSTGVVLAVGEGRLIVSLPSEPRGRCHVEPLRVKEGDHVFYSGYAAIKVSNDTDGKPETLLMFKEDDIIAILPPPVSPQ